MTLKTTFSGVSTSTIQAQSLQSGSLLLSNSFDTSPEPWSQPHDPFGKQDELSVANLI